MWGVGPATKARLAKIDVHTIGQLAEMPECGHSPHIQDPSGFWQSIKAFLDLKG